MYKRMTEADKVFFQREIWAAPQADCIGARVMGEVAALQDERDIWRMRAERDGAKKPEGTDDV